MVVINHCYLCLALCGPSDKILAEELSLNDRRQKREIKQLEEENERWRVRIFFIIAWVVGGSYLGALHSKYVASNES